MEAVIAKPAAHEREADFSDLVAETQRRVFQIALSVLRDSADAEEVAQDAYLRAYRRFARLRDPRKFQAWVCRIVFRLALNRRRSGLRRLARDSAWQAAGSRPLTEGDSEAVNRVFLARLREQIDRLPEKLRDTLLLCSVEGMNAREVAALLGVPTGTVRSRLHLARKKLLEWMKS